MNNRTEQVEVKVIISINIIQMVEFVYILEDQSMILCLEQYPVINGTPIRASEEINIIQDVRGVSLENDPNNRISSLWLFCHYKQ